MFCYSIEDVEVQYLGLSAKNTDLEESDGVRYLDNVLHAMLIFFSEFYILLDGCLVKQ